ncbi:MAG: hypothetical protein GZ089_04530 [Aromatoleum sp.]|nr:hypothetical protein [Aromatoleum sp.]
MQVTYINLDRNTERRAALEANFAAHNPQGWSLSRFAAVDGAKLDTPVVHTTLRPAVAACFLSHRGAVEQSAARDGDAMIAEDDVLFGPSSERVIAEALRSLPPDWDLLYTDVCISNFHTMLELFALRRLRTGRSGLLPLRGLPYAGSTAYIVNERSKGRMAELFAASNLSLAYDLWLRRLVYDGVLTGYATFPFATTLSTHADDSQIGIGKEFSMTGVWNAYRRLVWCDADPRQTASEVHGNDFDVLAADEIEMLRLLAQVIAGKCGDTWSPALRRAVKGESP